MGGKLVMGAAMEALCLGLSRRDMPRSGLSVDLPKSSASLPMSVV